METFLLVLGILMSIIGVSVVMRAIGSTASIVMHSREEEENERSRSFNMLAFIFIVFMGIPISIFWLRDHLMEQKNEPQQEMVEEVNEETSEETSE